MYLCDFCNKMSQPGEACKLVVVERRAKNYPAFELPKVFGDFKSRWAGAGSGHETVREKRMCPRCLEHPVHAHTIAISDGNYGKLQETAKVVPQEAVPA